MGEMLHIIKTLLKGKAGHVGVRAWKFYTLLFAVVWHELLSQCVRCNMGVSTADGNSNIIVKMGWETMIEFWVIKKKKKDICYGIQYFL